MMGPSGELLPLVRKEQGGGGGGGEIAIKGSEARPKGGVSSGQVWSDIKESWGIIMVVCLVNMHMWGSFVSLLPIGTNNAAPPEDPNGSVSLAWANNLGLLALVPGIVLAPMLRFSEGFYYWLSVVQVLLYLIIYSAILDYPSGWWGTYTSAVIVTTAFCFARFNEALIATSAYTLFGAKFQETSYQISSFMGVCDRIATTVMTWFAFVWVAYVSDETYK